MGLCNVVEREYRAVLVNDSTISVNPVDVEQSSIELMLGKAMRLNKPYARIAIGKTAEIQSDGRRAGKSGPHAELSKRLRDPWRVSPDVDIDDEIHCANTCQRRVRHGFAGTQDQGFVCTQLPGQCRLPVISDHGNNAAGTAPARPLHCIATYRSGGASHEHGFVFDGPTVKDRGM